MTAATKTKKTKVDELRPPVEIREITKARRAWLAEKLAEVNARPGFEGKIVGNGSYQVVSVYEITEVAGRLRHRGHCQFCGNSQVVDGDRLVLHGYERPGIGYVYNECPGVRKQPLEIAQHLTEACLVSSRDRLAELVAALDAAKVEQSAARDARFGGDDEVEPDAFLAQPHLNLRNPTDEQKAAHAAALAEWTVRFPVTARYEKAGRVVRDLEYAMWRAKQQVQHFELLLSWKLLGKPLVEEVVA